MIACILKVGCGFMCGGVQEKYKHITGVYSDIFGVADNRSSFGFKKFVRFLIGSFLACQGLKRQLINTEEESLMVGSGIAVNR